MEDSFRVRVDKAFGALGGSTPSSVGVSPSLWSLTDEEIERREWNRRKEEAEERDDGVESGSSDVRNQLDSDLQDLSDYEEEEEEEEEEDEGVDGEKKRRRRNNSSSAETSVDEYLDVQSNIGRDCTLDYEEEEDEYDKVAVGAEQTGDRLYMRDVKFADYGIDELNTYGELPNSFKAAVRDPRANHTAAKIRLKEDAEAAGSLDTLQLSDNHAAANAETEDIKKGELDGDNPKSILKKRENSMDSKSQKRVRFMVDPESRAQTHEEEQSVGASNLPSESHSGDYSAVPEQASDFSHFSSAVPDYIRNPAKYTRYTFDSSDDMDDQSNRKAYMDFFDHLRKRNTDSSEDSSIEIPKSITFTPKRKPEDDSMVKRSRSEHNTGDNLKSKSWSIGVTAEDAQESEVSAMEEDEPSPAVDKCYSLQKPSRQYRMRTNVNGDDNY
ncbi:neurofilament medium polypeptide [Sesamum indicum]|uniref:U5 small nuclear ribonucleoprotein TSSC4 n=1 Tax=Sesamum indicum TaxID=4182 RepID=A0A6I9SMU0_SESIN|nr:neurofilament medium polypeptide [Sesamum indicum]